jgi:hypothetical protein
MSDDLFVPLIGAGDVIFVVFGPAGGAPTRICRVAIGTQAWSCQGAGVTFAGGVLGEGGLIYIASQTGLEARRQADLSVEWTAPILSPLSTTLLDCSRDSTGAKLTGRPGVVYGQSQINAHRLFAVIVDSRGIDPTAPWPMPRHDPRSTGNLATSLAPFSCP